MRNKISITICLLSALLFSGCANWLDVKPATQADRDQLFTNQKGYSEALIGAYIAMSGSSLYGRHMTYGLIEALGGGYKDMGMNNLNVVPSYPYRGEDAEQDATIMDYIKAIWSNMYNVVANINSILDTIDENRGVFTGDNYELVKGEALGLHAFIHFELLRMFGEAYQIGKDNEAIPFVTSLSTVTSPLLTVDQALTVIIEELEEAVTLLEKDPIHLGVAPSPVLASLPSGSENELKGNNIDPWFNRRFHFNYYAAKATLARAYLWKGDKPAALRAALDVIGDQETRFPWALEQNITNIQSNKQSQYHDRTFATEHIFALNITGLEDLIDGYFVSKTSSSYDYLFASRTDFFEGDADPRQTQLIQNISNRDVLVKFLQRAVNDVDIKPYFIKRMPLIRVSEMYYIAAECAENPTEGLQYLQTVREQRRLADVPITDLSTLQNEIYKEYRKEFCGEGQLWFYYKRHGFETIPDMEKFDDIALYTFDRPADEDIYGNRITEGDEEDEENPDDAESPDENPDVDKRK